VTKAGLTTATSSASGPALPSGFLAAGLYWDVQTNASFGPPVEVCIDAAGVANPRLFHFEGGAAVDVTTRVDSPYVCGDATTLSPFVVATGDTTPPVLTVPARLDVDATSAAGAVVTYSVSARDNVDPAPKVRCSPASGAKFAIGDSLVRCTATDAAGNTGAASFTVHVRSAAEQIVRLVAKTRTYLGFSPLGPALLAELQSTADALVAHNRTVACGLLNVYIAGIKIAPSWLLGSAQKSELVADATRIRAVIGC
jgi:hypothetical protein